MAYVHSKKFCCCLPVRFGVFVMSLAALLGGALVAVAGWLQVMHSHDSDHPQLSKEDERALYIHAIMFTILALLGFFGLIGAISRKITLVSLFASMLAFHLGFSIATGIFTIVTLFRRNSQEAITSCLNGATDQTTEDNCRNGLKVLKGLVIAIYVVTWLVELYGCIIVNNYVKQLKEEEAIQPRIAVNPNAPMTTYSPPNNGYAFTQPVQSYGKTSV
ncbi:hypothetical protein B0H10DRAFT_1234375 [Mycena sp. CBHHK59/15]|nr:hypothetical protein B0H10DRAFT_2241883 [Mycena sp. CBHHK59/15]KAJ6554065.1 hypothetical protein B0H10DRAFT_1234375 [Mycena sp. CBHHK59/15]